MSLFHWFSRTDEKQTFKPVVLVTGCASGIGLATAQLLKKKHRYRVCVTARKKSLHVLKDKFKEDDRFWIRPLDVTSVNEREDLIKEISEQWGGVNVLINNAGISYRAVVEDMSDADEIKQMNVNYIGPMALIRLVLPHMRNLGRGKIINVSSVSGMLAMPTMSSYSASKYALEGASEALWYEAKPFGIDVCLVQPGFIHSHSFENVYYTEKSKPEVAKTGVYSDYYKNMTPFVTKMMKKSPTTPMKVAKLIQRTLRRESPPLWIPATWDAIGFYWIRRLMPRRWLLPFLFYCLPGARNWARKYTHRRHS